MPAAPPPVLPRHIAITMDGNGRWAAARALPRVAGHRAGLKPVRMCIEQCAARKVEALTLFAFSSENWGRPAAEVGKLMGLFLESLAAEIDELHARGVRVRFIGARERLGARLRQRIVSAEERTAQNPGLKLQIAMSYGGRWDIVQAAQRLARACVAGELTPEKITEERYAAALALAGLPPTELLVRTGGEQRLSNFLLWDAAYAELYFTDRLWPDFGETDLAEALRFFAGRERRFGKTRAQRAS
ncbi:MAG: di-trans,poly-cis-decaprenylcistransferase [Gammaproteobacteria bacterium]|nr:di-trans,poly-cis-decaprenylcistransferase [Gammaproteobacteria bacterium]MBV9696043.1 di-trans,poly-cis-decaprenylcistransferase [Gammaproteobacteria bacterium]